MTEVLRAVSSGAMLAFLLSSMWGTGLRNVGAALVLDEQDFHDPQAAVMVLIVSLLGVGFLIPVCRVWREPALERTYDHP